MTAADPLQRPGHNRILAALPREVIDRLRPQLGPVALGFKQVLYEPNQPISHVYFPCSGVMSMITILDDDTMIEVATVGNEGFVGVPIFLGATSMPGQAFCQVPGEAFRMEVGAFQRASESVGELREVLRRYVQGLFNQIAQSAACNRVHSIDERCARWLLMTHDRVGADTFPLTQEFLAQMLGVRRTGVSAAASILQKAGYVRYSRGVMTITDRAGLASAACECYRVVQDEYDRLLGGSGS